MRPHQYHVGELLFIEKSRKDTRHSHSSIDIINDYEDISIIKMNNNDFNKNINCSLYSNISSTKTRASSTSSMVCLNNSTTSAYSKPIRLVLNRPKKEKKKNIGLFLLSAKYKTIISKNKEKVNQSMSLPMLNRPNSQLMKSKKSNFNDISGWYFNDFDTNESQIVTVDKSKMEIKENVFDKLNKQYQFVNKNKRSSVSSVVNIFKKANKVKMKEDNDNKKKLDTSFFLKKLKLKY